jgi:hypothetical protein
VTCDCGRDTDRADGVCFACHVKGVGFTFRGAHLGQRGWHEGTVSEYKRDVYAEARANGTDITRA